MPRSNVWKVSSTDLYAYGVEVEHVEGLHEWPAVTVPSITIPGRDGELTGSTTRAITQSRLIRVTGTIDGRASTLDARLSNVADILERGLVPMEFPQFRASVLYSGRLHGPRIMRGIAPIFKQRLIPFDWTFKCDDPYGVDASATVVTGQSPNALSCPVGTAPSDVLITITANGGAVTTPILLHKNAAGTELNRIELPTLASAGHYHSIDTRNGGHILTNTGADANGMGGIINATSYRFPDLQPSYGTRGGTSQTITVTDGGGTADVSITYYKRWR